MLFISKALAQQVRPFFHVWPVVICQNQVARAAFSKAVCRSGIHFE